ncbi:hypothetical protein RYH73_25085, partial [Olivibacter sp. CPCC 100613]|uniref:hypothetical protein n=1 Tax=Olivibacter sp. CPCC 100613 TaxID=3079931 RepID=UPI002FF7436E
SDCPLRYMNHFFKELIGHPLALPACCGIPSHRCTASSFFLSHSPRPRASGLLLSPLRGCKGNSFFRIRKIFMKIFFSPLRHPSISPRKPFRTTTASLRQRSAKVRLLCVNANVQPEKNTEHAQQTGKQSVFLTINFAIHQTSVH